MKPRERLDDGDDGAPGPTTALLAQTVMTERVAVDRTIATESLV
jgi:hypothetical protein